MVQSGAAVRTDSARESLTTHQEEMMVLRFSSQIFKDCLLPVTFHVVPVVNHTMANRVMHSISRSFLVRKCFVSDEEVKILYAAL